MININNAHLQLPQLGPWRKLSLILPRTISVPPHQCQTSRPTIQFSFSHLLLCLVAKSCLTLVTPWAVAHQAFLTMKFSRQEFWSGLPFASSGDLPDPGIKPLSPALVCGFFTTEPPRKPSFLPESESEVAQSCLTLHNPIGGIDGVEVIPSQQHLKTCKPFCCC